MIRRYLASTALICVVGATVIAQQRPALRPHERSVTTAGAGPQKLRIDVPLLTGAQRFARVVSGPDGARAENGLADLRLFDASGRELAYLLVPPPRRRPAWFPGAVLPIAQTEKASGFEVDLGDPRDVDALAVDGLRPPFLKRFLLEGSGDRVRWTMLVGQGTLFDLPDERVRQTVVTFEPGPYRYLRVTWDDTNSGRLSPPLGARARGAAARSQPEPLRTAVSVQRQTSEPGRSRYRIQLPAAGLPVVSLLLDVAGDVFRTATVMETRFSGTRADPAELGRARLVRTEQRNGAAAPLRIGIETPLSSELQLVIEDGNNPPLSLEKAEVEFAELPVIYFEPGEGPVIAQYGDSAARPPEYDLEARRASINLAAVPEARWGEPRPVTTDDAPAAPPPAIPDRGARLDPGGFTYRRALPEGAGGLVSLQLDAAVLSQSRGPFANFGDVRIVDEQGNQIPYLIERRAEPLTIDLSLGPRTPEVRALREHAEGNRSTYGIKLPYSNLPSPRLVLETSDRVFRRVVQVGIERPPDRRRREVWFDVLAAPVWQHADQASAAPPLEIPIQPSEATDLMVIVEEGDNRPLAITAVRLLLPSWRLRFFRPAVPLRMIYGKADMAAPEYDLALLAPAVMGGVAQEISAAPPETASSPPAAVLSPRLFWIGLGAAVLVLLGLIVRLIRSGTAPPPSPPAP